MWETVERLETHGEWMRDAFDISFLTSQQRGVGTLLACRTRVGPVSTTDVLRITRWEPGQVIGVTHEGAVKGEGTFTITPLGGCDTRFCWCEQLSFPWWLGGRAGETVARPVLSRLWRANLSRLRRLLEEPE